ncbi:putative DNA-binding domain-containing protein (plasmid) [Cupriavidus sp. KK10]|jgi:hypothetical protein|uniref:HvfC/BufC N-terminal domain-containing protein n=1 Tax=Cupriavidus sp. KK10 TaxID=1478019 RepID=UPI001BAC8A7F|nr:DNA-binding domain-containing protein [Cupriavidus sp. KK10]QUN32241.1 putative DNA-binding domain-containing protein [Cupriavidus sp. KK10]
MQSDPPSLLELQRAFAQELGNPAAGGASAHVIADGLVPQARLGIYRNTATATLVGALRLSYPAVQALVGPEFFEGAARLFIGQSAPQSAWLDAYGEAFAEFLARLPEAAAIGYLPDVARLEWAVSAVLHAPDATPLDLRRLAESDVSAAGDIRFLPHPAVRVVHAAFPVDAIWRAVLNRDDHALARIDPAVGPVWLLVRRTSDAIDVDRLSAWQWQFTAALLAGHPLHAALGPTSPADAHAWLATLLSAGSFTGFGRAQASDLRIPDLSP